MRTALTGRTHGCTDQRRDVAPCNGSADAFMSTRPSQLKSDVYVLSPEAASKATAVLLPTRQRIWKHVVPSIKQVAVICDQWLLVLGRRNVLWHPLQCGVEQEGPQAARSSGGPPPCLREL